MIAFTCRRRSLATPASARFRIPLGHTLTATAALMIAGLTATAPASAASVIVGITVNGAGYDGAPLDTGKLYAIGVSLTPVATPEIGRTSINKLSYCNGERSGSPEYCVTEARSHISGTPTISNVLINGVDPDADIAGTGFTVLEGSYIPISHQLTFTETFSEQRSFSTYFYGGGNPGLDGFTTNADLYKLVLPTGTGGSPLSCGFTGNVDFGATAQTTYYNVTASCSLTLTYAFPTIVPPPSPPPLPPSVPSVPEPATWLMMIAGFGAIGASMRRRTARITGLA